jgi:hypothetical protein
MGTTGALIATRPTLIATAMLLLALTACGSGSNALSTKHSAAHLRHHHTGGTTISPGRSTHRDATHHGHSGPTHRRATNTTSNPSTTHRRSTERATTTPHHTRSPSRPPAAILGPRPVATGTYRYHQTGSQTIAGFTSGLDPHGALQVGKAKPNGRQTSHLILASHQPPSDQTMQFTNHGMFLLADVQRYAFAGHTETIRCTFHPGLPFPPWPLSVGSTFKGGGSCGNVHVSGSGHVISRRAVTIGGRSLQVFVINSTLKTTGGVTSTSTDLEWFAPTLRLSVRDAGKTTGSFGPVGFRSTFVRTLISTQPR